MRLDGWITRSEWRSYDPDDYKALPSYRRLIVRQIAGKDRWTRWLKKAIDGCSVVFPHLFRRILGLQPIETPHGEALLAMAYCQLFQVFRHDVYIDKATVAIQRVYGKRLRDLRYTLLGLPFDWQSRRYFPANIPMGPTTYWCGWSFLEYAELTKRKEQLEMARRAARSFGTVFPFKEHSSESCSMNFTDCDDFEVINVACSAASLMMMVGTRTDDAKLVSNARRLATFVMETKERRELDVLRVGPELRATVHRWPSYGNGARRTA